jgi:Domain of unknown function (DUF4129)
MINTAERWSDLFNPRHELVLLASAGLEICWAYGFFALALAAMGHAERGVSVFTFAALVIAGIYGARFTLNSDLPLRRKQAVGVGLAALSIMLAIRLTLFANYGVFDLGWIGQIPAAAANMFIAFSPIALLLLMGIYAWWRGLSLAQASFDFDGVGFRFRLGVLMIALQALVNTWVGRIDMGGLLTAFFFFGLLAVALARQEDLGRSEANVALPLKGPWLGILTGSVLLVLGMAALLALVLTPQGIRAILDLFRPLEPLVVVVLYAILIVVSFLVEIIYNLLAAILQRLINPNAPPQPLILLPRPPPAILQQPDQLNALAAYFDPLRIICAVVLVGGILLAMALSLNNMQRRARLRGNESRESVPVSIDLNALRRLRDWLRKPEQAADDSDVASIKRIYANLLKLAARRGFPRRAAETPYEFMRDLRETLPSALDEERAITDAYVRVHYGEHAPAADELAKVREAWQKVREEDAANKV